MHSCGRYCTAVIVALASLDVCAQADLKRGATAESSAAVPSPVAKVPPTAGGPTVKSPAAARYEELLAQEQSVSQSTAATVEDLRVVINRYWSFVQRYPASGFADNAVWQAAALSAQAFERFGQERDKYRAVQLFQWLRDQYPHSSLQAKAGPQIEKLESIAAAAAPTTTPAVTGTTIRGVYRTVLAEVVRVTLELDREVPFYQERLEGPARVFFDLKGTKTVPSLVDATFRYDSDVVRHIRIGRHPNNTTRVVLDLENVSRFSVFTLYNPYRIVIDAERSAGIVPKPPGPTLLVARMFAPRAITPFPGLAPVPRIEPPATVALASRSFPARAALPVAVIARAAIVLPASPPPSTAAKPAAKRVVPTVPTPPIAPPAPVAAANAPPPAPSAPVTTTGGVIVGKPIPPSANSSGKFSVARQLGLGVSRIVIDAGHGGHDPGASAFGISEAELVLDVTLRLEALLLQQPGTEVVLTRRTNDFLPLEERTEIANREAADLFLSVHANASANAAASGVETYFLNFALNRQAEAVAARENAASGKTMSSLPSIIKAITLNSKLNESRDFAASVQRSMVRGMRPANKTLRDLGVKQAPFMVLIGASMPSVLAEISFVTNQLEARLLKDPAYRQRIAESLLAGILRYQQSLKKVQTATVN
jgi:N-acetylmuramoyl-L-alanine amidase